MRTTERTIDLGLIKQSMALTERFAQFVAMVASVCRAYRNRVDVNRLHDLDDNQLKDIGLTRADLQSALLASSLFQDPSHHLTKSARNRARLSVFRSRTD